MLLSAPALLMPNALALPLASLVQPSQVIIIIGVVIAVMLSVFVFVIIFLVTVTYEQNVVKDRLIALKLNSTPISTQKAGPFDELWETMMAFSAPLAKKLYGQNDGFQKKTKQMLTEAGMSDSDTAVWQSLTAQVATGLVMGIAGFIGSFFFAQNLAINIGAGIFGLLLGRNIAQLNLRMRAKRRKTEIRYNLPDALDLMVVCVEAGLGLDATIHRVAEDLEAMAPDIALELKRVTRELNAGVSRLEAFHNLGTRSGVEELKSLCALITQSDKLGTSISDVLRVYADDMRVRRRQKAEELAAKASIKITFPLVLFIFPPLFIILLGPTVIQAMKTFGGGGVFGAGH
ncbi:MAG: type II secretion system F family protein [Vampirovibrionales bacterium]|nr:type II secretion system F family protein [Vampirovibrionales bacterium]